MSPSGMHSTQAEASGSFGLKWIANFTKQPQHHLKFSNGQNLSWYRSFFLHILVWPVGKIGCCQKKRCSYTLSLVHALWLWPFNRMLVMLRGQWLTLTVMWVILKSGQGPLFCSLEFSWKCKAQNVIRCVALVGYRDPYELDDLARWSSGFGSLAAHTFFKRYIALSRTYPDSRFARCASS